MIDSILGFFFMLGLTISTILVAMLILAGALVSDFVR